MPPRPHRLLLTALALATSLLALLLAPRPAWPNARHADSTPPPHATWRWPLRGPVVGAFRITPAAPFARGQRRGIDIAAAPGTPVRAACPGVVTFTGALPRHGRAVTVRCGALVATYLRLGHVAVHRGTRVRRGRLLATLGASGRLRLGARRAADRRGYIDPLALLSEPATRTPPTLGPAPRSRRPRPEPARPLPPSPAAAPIAAPTATGGVPWPAYPALALIASALPVGTVIHRRRRPTTATAAAVAHEGS